MGRIELKGMTWDHSRGFDPMVATSKAYSTLHPNVSITWEKRSLQAFADRPIEEMAGAYDLMVIDHPHVGEVAQNGQLLALDGLGHDAKLNELAAQSVGQSHPSYNFEGRQWALAIDAATPVAAYRPDRLDEAPKTWSEVLELAHKGDVGFALIPINALMTFFGFLRNKEVPIAQDPQHLVAHHEGQECLERMLEITSLMSPRCLELDPIGIYEWMGRVKDAPAYSPFGYGYTNYSRHGYCEFPLNFADAPGIDNNGPRGTVLGGTGIAVSAMSAHKETAVDYAFWIAGAECQSTVFFENGGQPGNAYAWENDACNAACRDFLKNTRQTLETSWVRPRYNGYMQLQEVAGDIIHACLRGQLSVNDTLIKLDEAYCASRNDV